MSNAFTFRGVETLRDILVARGWVGLPVWATEFNWIRKPAEDGYELNCDANADYQTTFRWQEVTASASGLSRPCLPVRGHALAVDAGHGRLEP